MFSEAKQITEEVQKDVDFLINKSRHSTGKVRRKKSTDNEFYRFFGVIPTERRKSERLLKCNPKYSFTDLDKIIGPDDDVKDKVKWLIPFLF